MDGTRTRAGGRTGTLQPWATHQAGPVCKPVLTSPPAPACRARPRRTPAARWGTAGSLLRRAVSSLLFVRGLEEHTSPVDAVQPETQLAGPLTTQGRPIQRKREGGPEWPSGHTVMLPLGRESSWPLPAGREAPA